MVAALDLGGKLAILLPKVVSPVVMYSTTEGFCRIREAAVW